MYTSEKCDSFSFRRLFLNARNRKINRFATRFSSKKISWFEHLEWWKNKNIKKFIIKKRVVLLNHFFGLEVLELIKIDICTVDGLLKIHLI